MLIRVLIFGYLCVFANWSVDGEVQLFPEITNAFQNTENKLCNEHNQLFRENLKNMTLWAYEMWESTGRSPVGILSGNNFQLGHFDECLMTESPFEKQYCLVEMHINFPRVNRDKFSTKYSPNESAFVKFYFTGDKSRVPRNILNIGLCLPLSCSAEDIEKSINENLQTLNLNNSHNLTYTAKIQPNSCQQNRVNEKFTAGDISFCLLMLIILFLVIICTIFDLRNKIANNKTFKIPLYKKLGLCFSVVRNLADLPKKDESNSALEILYGMRTFSICMIIIDHRCGSFITGPVFNRDFVEQHFRSFASLFIFHGDLFVDSFFVLSGLLVTYNLMISFDKRYTSPFLIIFNRYIRLTPIYAVVIFFYATLLYKTGSGPLWNLIIGNMQSDCQNNWWASIFYISNYVNDDKMCMVHSWYLPCDFHYFILAIPMTILLRKKAKMGLGILSIALIVSIIIPFGITLYYQRPALLHFYQDFLTAPKIHPDFRLTYTKSHTRATAYIIGMFTGYTYYKLRNSTIRLSLMKSTMLTLFGLLLMFAGMTSGGIFYDPYHGYNAWEAALYASLHRPAWALGSALLLLNASYGKFGIMKLFLEWEPWVPLSKLVYGAYLIHMCWQFRFTAMIKNPVFLDELTIVTQALGDIVISFSLALLLYLMIEAPFRKIFRELMNGNRTILEQKPENCLRQQVMENGTEDSQL